MANQEHLVLLKEGVEVWNHWRNAHRDVKPDLSGIDLTGTHLNDARLSFSCLKGTCLSQAQLQRAYFVQSDLSSANLSEALLTEAHLDCANLKSANLSGAKLSHAKIRLANLSGANLSGADLSYANLDRANFSHAQLSGIDLSFARVRGTAFDHVDLSSAQGLETMIHNGRSRLGLYTLTRSYQHLPEAFLQGTGVTETLLDAVLARGDSLLEYPTCLICYARSDETFVQRLQQDLQAQGVVYESLPYDADTATSAYASEVCMVYDQLLLLLSEGMTTSDSLHDRLSANTLYSIQKDAWGKTVRLRLHQLTPLQERLLIPRGARSDKDFTRWREHDEYQKALDGLLQNLKARSPHLDA